MSIDEIVKLIEAVSGNGLTSFVYEKGDEKLVLKKKKKKNVSQAPVVISQPPSPMMAPMTVPGPALQIASAAGTETAPQAAAEAGHLDIGSDKVVVSPLVGTFYSASSPEAEPFAKVGDTVKKGQVLGIIEAMKLMNEIESDHDGVIEAVLVENEEIVEYGQPLFRIR